MTLRKILVLIAASLMVVNFIACDDETSITSAQRLEAEKQIYLQFLSENYSSYKAQADTTIGDSTSFDLKYWELNPGFGDTTNNITLGNTVAIRYQLYSLQLNDSLRVDTIPQQSNINTAFPYEFTVASSVYTLSTYYGLNQGVQYMRKGAVGYLLMPSSLTDNSYYSSLYKIEVVFVSH